MDSSYLYSGTYASILTSQLLSPNQRELLVASSSLDEVRTILLDTPFASFVNETTDIKQATNLFVCAQVDALRRLIPDSTVFSILTLRSDYYNLKQIVLNQRAKRTDEECIAACQNLGSITPERLLRLVTTNTLRFSYPELGRIYTEIIDTNPLPHDTVDAAHLTHLKQLSEEYPDSFIERYVTLTIDLHNLMTRLRVLAHPESDALQIDGSFVTGGSMTKSGLESLETVLLRLTRFGGEPMWREAVAAFASNRNFTLLDQTADNYFMRFLKRESIAVHSPAPLFAYYHAMLEHAQFIDAVVTARNAGLDQTTLRTLTRHSLLEYAY